MEEKDMEKTIKDFSDKIRKTENKKLEDFSEEQLHDYINQTNQDTLDYATKLGMKTEEIGDEE